MEQGDCNEKQDPFFHSVGSARGDGSEKENKEIKQRDNNLKITILGDSKN